jgi:tRNA threonylcarbamoyl adenosine modification protein YjeE
MEVEFGVKSPSFAIHLEYPGRITLHHLDLYRLGDPRDLDELGLEDIFGREGVSAVEWGDRLGDMSPTWAVRVGIEDLSPECRKITLAGPRDTVERLALAAGLEVDRA